MTTETQEPTDATEETQPVEGIEDVELTSEEQAEDPTTGSVTTTVRFELPPPLRFDAIIQGGRFAGDGQFDVLLRFPMRGNMQAVMALASGHKSLMQVTLEELQMPLFSAPPPADMPAVEEPPEVETVDMTVNGEPAKVRRPRRNGAHAEEPRPEQPRDANGTPLRHPFQHHTADNQCYVCGLAEDNELHEEPFEVPVSDAAQALIDEARRRPATEAEAREQEEAATRLAGRAL